MEHILKDERKIKKKLQVAVEMKVNPQTQTRNENNEARMQKKELRTTKWHQRWKQILERK